MAREELVFSDYLRVVLRRKGAVLLTAILTLGVTYYYAGREVPVYESRSRLKIQRIITFADMFDEVMVSSGNPIENYLYEITSYVVISNASVALAAPRIPALGDIADLKASVRATQVERTDLLDVMVRGSGPEIARQRNKAILEAFVSHHDRAMASNAEEVYNSIKQSRDNLLNNLKTQEASLWKKMGPGMLTPEGSGETALLKARLVEQEIQLQALRGSGNYTEEFPEIKTLKEQIKSIQERINLNLEQEFERQVQVTEYQNQKTIVQDMSLFFTRKLEEAKIATEKKTEVIQIIEPPSLGQAITKGWTRNLFAGGLLGLMLGVVLAFIADSLDTSIRTLAEIEDAFKVPVLGVIPHFSPDTVDVPLHTETLWDRIRFSRSVASLGTFWKALGSALGARKNRSSGTRRKELIVPFAPRSPATEGYRILRTNMQLITDRSAAKVFLVTSSGPAEGKSTTTANLATAFAQGGKKVLLIGANMRRPQMYKIFGLERDRGLSNILSGELPWRDVIKDFRDIALSEGGRLDLATAPGLDHLFFITAGGKTTQPAEWLSLPAFEQLLAEVKNEFDLVLVDGTPVLPVPDSSIIAQSVDQVLLVYQLG
ncbi:MAG: polysaccharide biosynthesis tyrosine autokinase, partial [Lentisphaerota bacterium]